MRATISAVLIIVSIKSFWWFFSTSERRYQNHRREAKKRLPCCFSQIQKTLSGQNNVYSKRINPIIAERRMSVFFEKNSFFEMAISVVAQNISTKNTLTFTDSKLQIPFSIIKDSQSLAKVCENMRGIMIKMERREYMRWQLWIANVQITKYSSIQNS